MEHDIPFRNSNRENGPTFLDFPLFLGIFQWDDPTKSVPFTSEPDIPEILTKWKAPHVACERWMYLLSLRKDKSRKKQVLSRAKNHAQELKIQRLHHIKLMD